MLECISWFFLFPFFYWRILFIDCRSAIRWKTSKSIKTLKYEVLAAVSIVLLNWNSILKIAQIHSYFRMIIANPIVPILPIQIGKIVEYLSSSHGFTNSQSWIPNFSTMRTCPFFAFFVVFCRNNLIGYKIRKHLDLGIRKSMWWIAQLVMQTRVQI